ELLAAKMHSHFLPAIALWRAASDRNRRGAGPKRSKRPDEWVDSARPRPRCAACRSRPCAPGWTVLGNGEAVTAAERRQTRLHDHRALLVAGPHEAERLAIHPPRRRAKPRA